MKNHFDLAGRSLKLSVLSALFLVTPTALAQEESEAASSAGLDGSAEAAEPGLETTTSPSTSEEAPASNEAASETDSTEGADAALEANASTTAAEASGDGAKPAAGTYPKPPPLALEILPPSGYPNQKVGIKNGSLRFAMPGLQWPYMPSYGPDQPRLRIAFSGSSWLDANMRMVRPGRAEVADVLDLRMQGRLTLRVTPTYNFDNDWFAQSRIEFIAITEQQHEQGKYVDVDEAWVRVGRWKRFDATVGRTQGFEVYHFGMGLDINTQEREGARPSVGANVQQAYALTELWDRGINNGAIALHWYLPEWLRLELLGRMGIAGTGNDAGVRPAAILDFGMVKVKGGMERREQWQSTADSAQKTETTGYSGNLHFVFDPWIEFGGGISHRIIDAFNNEGAPIAANSTTTTTWGGFLNVRPYLERAMVGIGYHDTSWQNFNFENADPTRPENQHHQQMFAAAQYQLWDVLYIKYVLAYSQVHIESRIDEPTNVNTGFTDKQISHRLRFMLLF